MKKSKKAFLLLSTYLIILFTPKFKNNSTPNYSINESHEYNSSIPFGTYSNGDVFIANEETIIRIINDENEDIYIIDDRRNSDSNIQIYNSYKIDNYKEMLEITRLLLEYEKLYPSNWDRTEDSMLNEWLVHNLCFKFGYKPINTQMVDLNNADEEKYNSKLLTFLLR